MMMPDDFTQGFQYGLNDLPLEPPDDPNTLFSPNGFTSIGMQRAGSAQVIPAQFKVLGRGMQPPGWYPNQGRGLAPGGGPVTEIPMPEAWKTLKKWGPLLPEILRSLHPSELVDSALSGPDDSVYPMATLGRGRQRKASARSRSQARADDGDWCYQRYLQELERCNDNKDNYAHPHFLGGCKDRAKERWDKCNRNGGRPPLEELPEWGKEDEDIYFETSR
jgi:hypothetical protein